MTINRLLINYIIAKAKEDGVAITDQDTLSYYINKKLQMIIQIPKSIYKNQLKKCNRNI